LALLVLLCAATLAQPAKLRVGVLFFQDESDPLSKLREFSEQMPEDVETEYAIGTYGELAHWLKHGLVDIAVVNPGLYARLDDREWTYLGSRRVETESELRTVWLARKDGPTTLAKVKATRPEILAVHPLSVSGFINPVSALQRSGIELNPDQVRFTHSHSGSIDALLTSATLQIACVWEPTWTSRRESDLVEIEVDGLNDVATPPMVVVGRTGTMGSKILKDLIGSGKVDGFIYDPKYQQMIEALPAPPLEWSNKALDRVDLDDLILTLRQYNRTHPNPARLGLVLAGGGAKCSYQAGAVRALEERLESAREKYQDNNLDIHLVVGTSGGAINALSIAMGLTKTAEGYQDLREAWLDLNQKEIVSPPFLVRLNMWLWFASVAGLGLLFFSRWRKLSRSRALLITSLIGFTMALLPRLPVKISYWLGGSAELQYFWTWLSFGIEGAGFVLLAAAVAWEGLSRAKERRGKEMLRLSLVRWLTLLVAILPLIQTWTILWHEEVISENRGLEAALLRNFGRLVNQETARRGESEGSAGQSIGELSGSVFSRKLLTRDLVLTASPLPEPGRELPAEYYFYAAAAIEGSAPEFGSRGVALNEHPDILFDAMLGSAAIYPLFPARHVEGLPEKGESVDLVDGSFAHRSPLEAAVEWGATHVLVIEASTQEMPQRGKFLQNMGAALTFLYDQAQLTDVRSEGETVLYTLYPSAPHIGLLDFSAPLLEGSLEKGYLEASGAPSRGSQDGGALHKLQGPPDFWEP
jgi:predicted acylesterase/phospholipase RssA